MPLYDADETLGPDSFNADDHADEIVINPLPRKNFPLHTQQPEQIFQILKNELLLDGNSKQNLATFCQTWESEQVHELMDLAVDKNLIDKDEREGEDQPDGCPEPERGRGLVGSGHGLMPRLGAPPSREHYEPKRDHPQHEGDAHKKAPPSDGA